MNLSKLMTLRFIDHYVLSVAGYTRSRPSAASPLSGSRPAGCLVSGQL